MIRTENITHLAHMQSWQLRVLPASSARPASNARQATKCPSSRKRVPECQARRRRFLLRVRLRDGDSRRGARRGRQPKRTRKPMTSVITVPLRRPPACSRSALIPPHSPRCRASPDVSEGRGLDSQAAPAMWPRLAWFQHLVLRRRRHAARRVVGGRDADAVAAQSANGGRAIGLGRMYFAIEGAIVQGVEGKSGAGSIARGCARGLASAVCR